MIAAHTQQRLLQRRRPRQRLRSPRPSPTAAAPAATSPPGPVCGCRCSGMRDEPLLSLLCWTWRRAWPMLQMWPLLSRLRLLPLQALLLASLPALRPRCLRCLRMASTAGQRFAPAYLCLLASSSPSCRACWMLQCGRLALASQQLRLTPLPPLQRLARAHPLPLHHRPMRHRHRRHRHRCRAFCLACRLSSPTRAWRDLSPQRMPPPLSLPLPLLLDLAPPVSRGWRCLTLPWRTCGACTAGISTRATQWRA